LEAREHVEAGNDPRLVLAGQTTAGMTVSTLVDVYLADPERAALRSKAEIERRLRRNVVPAIALPQQPRMPTMPTVALRVTERGHRSWCFHFRSPR
jgi:hypothetical protein